MGDFDKYYEERYDDFTWYEKILAATIWPIQFYIQDQIDLLKYRLYCKLYLWAVRDRPKSATLAQQKVPP